MGTVLIVLSVLAAIEGNWIAALLLFIAAGWYAE